MESNEILRLTDELHEAEKALKIRLGLVSQAAQNAIAAILLGDLPPSYGGQMYVTMLGEYAQTASARANRLRLELVTLKAKELCRTSPTTR